MAPAGIAVIVEADAPGDRTALFEAIVPIDLTTIFRGLGPLPAVVATREQTGGWDHEGATRVVELADGSEAREQITSYLAPEHFAYRLSGFTGQLGLLASHAEGAWWFSEARPGTTHVRWMYVFHPRPGRALIVRALVAPLWRVYQRRALMLALASAR